MQRKLILLVLFPMLCLSTWSQEIDDVYGVQMRKLLMTYQSINSLYVDTVDANKIVESAVIAMLKELDPHSAYISPEDVAKANEPLQGNFDGIGVQFNVLEDTLIVISPIAGGPSEKVGIQAGDRVVKVDTTTIAGVKCSRTKMVELLRGPKGTPVKLTIKRKGVSKLLSYRVIRDKIPIYSVDAAYMVTPKIGYIKINRFSATTYREFMKALYGLKMQGLKSLIIDLQGNGGGYMQPAIELADQLLDKDKLIVYTEGFNSPKQQFSSRGDGVFDKGNLVILVDESSASASEILSGAIQDWDRGTIIGRRTFGKGLVQKPLNLPDGGVIRLTTARYHTPSGRCIQKPYVKGEKSSYNKDLMERFDRGELVNVDSINFPDSLKYKTLVLGKTVYGGGGIIPDVFVPLDTTTYSDFHKEIIAQGVLNQFMLIYIDNNREELLSTYPNFKSFDKNYQVTEALFQELVNKAAEDSIVYDQKEFEISHDFLFLQMKALVARDLFEISEYYEVLNTRNTSVIAAIEELSKKKKTKQ